MKVSAIVSKCISPFKACAFLVLAVYSFNAQAEYYYVENAPFESSPKCVSLKRYKCERHCSYRCHKPRRYKRVKRYYYYRPAPVVRYYEPAGSCGYGGCSGYSSCVSCNGNYFPEDTTRYAYVCNDCDSLWTSGYMCHGRWVSGHWR